MFSIVFCIDIHFRLFWFSPNHRDIFLVTVPIMVDALEMQIIYANQKYQIYNIQIYNHKSDQKNSHEVLQLVAVEIEVWTASEIPVKYPSQT
jgi:hypothetical protein